MEKILKLCEYSHDYDGFVFEEDDCCCILCRKGKEFYLCQEDGKRINYEDCGRGHKEIPITDEDLKLCKKELCLKFCKSDWAKTYDIHRSWDEFKNPAPLFELIENKK